MTHEELSYLLMIVATATDKESDQDALSHHAATADYWMQTKQPILPIRSSASAWSTEIQRGISLLSKFCCAASNVDSIAAYNRFCLMLVLHESYIKPSGV